MNALLAQFIPEARDLLEQAGTGMLALERDASSQTVINDVFRAVHTLKGSSGLFDVMPLTRLVHAAEDLLGEVRMGELALNSDIVDRLLDSLDLVGQLIDALEARETLPSDAESLVDARVAVMRAWLAHRPAGEVGSAVMAAPSPLAFEAPGWLVDLPEAERIAAFKAVSGRRLLAWSFDPEEDCFFRGDDPVAMIRHSPGLLALRVRPRDPFPALQMLEPLACLLRFEVLSDAPREAIAEHMRYVAERIDVRDIEAGELAIPTGAAAGGPVFGDFARLARQYLEAGDRPALERSVATLMRMVAPACSQGSALRWCKVYLECYGLERLEDLQRLIAAVETGKWPRRSSSDDRSERREDRAQDASYREMAHRIGAEQITVLKTPTDAAIAPGRRESVAVVLKNVAKASGISAIEEKVDEAIAVLWQNGDLAPLGAIVGELGTQPELVAASDPAMVEVPPAVEVPSRNMATEARESGPAADTKTIQRVLRIDQSKIDSIMNLVAELIVAKNGLSYLATRAEQIYGSRAMAREIKDQFAIIDRIAQGLQVGVMSVRMMPVSQVFQRFPRLVRDISRKLGKQIELVIEGEDTEADKNVLESLADPLIHMVRNSLDHGIETPEERRAAGKSERGTVRIAARQENDFVVIEVRDDGKGIDPLGVKAKAVQSGLISAEAAEQMSDEEAANLVFAPGFSTKAEVSDLSGRGVGMDVVRSAVLKAGGDVTLHSKVGSGTCVTARLPLTMAVSRIVTIECRGRIFGIPMDLVVETVRIRRQQIHRIKTMETFVLRDTIIPIVRLADALRLSGTDGRIDSEDEAVMVVRLGRDRVGLIVDGFRERMEVIVKPLEGILGGTPGISGTALLGDGRVLLILDLQEML